MALYYIWTHFSRESSYDNDAKVGDRFPVSKRPMQLFALFIPRILIELNFSPTTPTNAILTYTTTILYSSYMFLCHLRHPRGALHDIGQCFVHEGPTSRITKDCGSYRTLTHENLKNVLGVENYDKKFCIVRRWKIIAKSNNTTARKILGWRFKSSGI